MTGAIRPPTGLPAEQNTQWVEESSRRQSFRRPKTSNGRRKTPVCGNKKRGFPERHARREPRRKNAAACYSPTPSRVQYHRRASHLGHDHRKTNTTANPPGDRPANGTSHTTDSDRGGPGTGQRTRTKTLHRYRHRDHKKTMLLAIQRKKPPQDETRPSKRVGKSVPRSPVSTGRLHPSRGFHLRPIEHVFNMRATGAPGSVKES